VVGLCAVFNQPAPAGGHFTLCSIMVNFFVACILSESKHLLIIHQHYFYLLYINHSLLQPCRKHQLVGPEKRGAPLAI
jgi:hypothetical protein